MTIISEKVLWARKPLKKRIGDKAYWARIKISWDKNTKQDFFDILIGRRFEGELREKRLHYGITLNQNLLFANPREIGIFLKREVTSELRGLLTSNEIKFNNQIKEMLKGILISFKLEGNTGEVFLDRFEFIK